MRRFKDKITGLLREFEQRFQIFGELEKDFKVFCSPFSVNGSDLPVNIQLEIIDLQCDSDLKGKFAAAGLDTFYQHLLPGYPSLTALAAKVFVHNSETIMSSETEGPVSRVSSCAQDFVLLLLRLGVQSGKPVCLVCSQQVSVLKEYNLRRHYEILHAEKYKNLQGQQRLEKVNELLTALKKQQSVFSRSREISDAAVKASYLIANEIALRVNL
ncbi:general transcription factor II-I repeat domain-containing protein 2-like [Penaeus monodon]|uniref:general transcription factor II-I repeat domain-containing protein 2-like n=1 Tax=Penaeus monodon TaxID=6687 RepID=UPI0018A7C2C3|nr:general transcription factor II-I repeat domain-containing protein 2-like [Penaeus monodon]